jgi:hypothetical protein
MVEERPFGAALVSKVKGFGPGASIKNAGNASKKTTC